MARGQRLTLPGLETPVEDWRATAIGDIASHLTAAARPSLFVIAVDGRSGGGKSTFAAAMAAELDAALLHTDDFAWWHSMFDWPELLIDDALNPLREGHPVDFRPTSWVERNRDGSITAPARRIVVVEGVGAGQQRMRADMDAIVWVQSDADESERRGIARDLAERPDPEEARRFWNEWMAAENVFHAEQETWLAADLYVCGTPEVLGPDPSPAWLTSSRL